MKRCFSQNGLFLACWIFLGGLPAFSPAELGSVGGIEFNPQVFRVAMNKAENSREMSFFLRNVSSQSIRVAVESRLIYPMGKKGETRPAWIFPESQEVEIQAGIEKTVKFVLHLSEQVKGECKLMIYFANRANGPNVDLVTRVGLPIFVLRTGTQKISAVIRRFELKRLEHKNETIVLGIANNGNVAVIPFGFVQLIDSTRNFTKPIDFRGQELILPGETKEIELAVDDPAHGWQGEYLARLELFLDEIYGLRKDGKVPEIQAKKRLEI